MGSKPPAKSPCGSCPYRKDVPSGVWSASEYDKLPAYDEPEMWNQPQGMFGCHQNDGRLCAGWVGCHDMHNNLALRIAIMGGHITGDDIDEILEYETKVPLWESGQAAAEHGKREIESPGEKASRVVSKLVKTVPGIIHEERADAP